MGSYLRGGLDLAKDGMVGAVAFVDEATRPTRWDIGTLEDVTGFAHSVAAMAGCGTYGQLGKIAGAVGSVSDLLSWHSLSTYFLRTKRLDSVKISPLQEPVQDSRNKAVRDSAMADLNEASTAPLLRLAEKVFRALSLTTTIVRVCEDLGALETVTETIGSGLSLLSPVGVSDARSAGTFFTMSASAISIGREFTGKGETDWKAVVKKIAKTGAKVSLLYLRNGNKWAFRLGTVAMGIGTMAWLYNSFQAAADEGVAKDREAKLDSGVLGERPDATGLSKHTFRWVRDGFEGIASTAKGVDKMLQTALGVIKVGALNKIGAFMLIDTVWSGTFKTTRNIIKIPSAIKAIRKDILGGGLLESVKKGDYLSVVATVGYFGSNLIAGFQKMGGFGWIDLNKVAALVGRVKYVGPVLTATGAGNVRRYLVGAAFAATAYRILTKNWQNVTHSETPRDDDDDGAEMPVPTERYFALKQTDVVELLSTTADAASVVLGPSAAGTAAGALWDVIGGAAAVWKLTLGQRILQPSRA